MAFTWKEHKDIWKGEGIYHLTFSVTDRKRLFGTVEGQSREAIAEAVRPLRAAGKVCDVNDPEYVATVCKLAWVKLTPFGKAVEDDIAHFDERHPGVTVCAKKLMDNHLHVVLWVRADTGRSILQLAQGFRTGITKIAREMGVWGAEAAHAGGAAAAGGAVAAVDEAVAADGAVVADAARPGYRNALNSGGVSMGGACGAPNTGTPNSSNPTTGTPTTGTPTTGAPPAPATPYHVVERPYVRTLVGKGQLRTMIDYVLMNPYRRWVKVLNPDLFTMRKDTRVKGLRFRSMGNHWLLDWPNKQMVECTRYSTQVDWDKQLEAVLRLAEMGAVTYTAAISDGERYICQKVREAGYPLVILLKDGFPPAGSEHERMYKPGGVYFAACAEGRLLLLLEGYAETYSDARVVDATEQALRQKAAMRQRTYVPLPHESSRWRFMAGNEIVRNMTSLTCAWQ